MISDILLITQNLNYNPMAYVSNPNDEKLEKIKEDVKNRRKYDMHIKLEGSFYNDLYMMYTSEIIPNTNDPIVLCHAGIFYDTVISVFLKSEEYFIKALENGCKYSAWYLALLYSSDLTFIMPPESKNKVFVQDENFNKYYKYLRLSLNAYNVDACCKLLNPRVNIPSKHVYNICMVGVKRSCEECMLKLVNLLFDRGQYDESLYLCNIFYKRDKKDRTNHFIEEILFIIGENMLELNLYEGYCKKISRKNKNIRRKLENVYPNEVGNIIMNYYTVNWNKK